MTYTILDVPSELFTDDAPCAFVVVQLDDGPRCTGWMPCVKRPGDIASGDRIRFMRAYKPGMVFQKASIELQVSPVSCGPLEASQA